jgi:hypothetical protein
MTKVLAAPAPNRNFGCLLAFRRCRRFEVSLHIVGLPNEKQIKSFRAHICNGVTNSREVKYQELSKAEDIAVTTEGAQTGCTKARNRGHVTY